MLKGNIGCGFPKTRNKARMSAITISTQYCIKCSAGMARERNKRNKDWKENYLQKILLLIQKILDNQQENVQNSWMNLTVFQNTRLIGKNSIAFIFGSIKYLENKCKTKKFEKHQKAKYVGINLIFKKMQNLYFKNQKTLQKEIQKNVNK